ncbi:tyrosine-type recombinase/integrase [Mycobacterium sp. Y57]|uniref:tyrosine-type recombinase/integrase n=1 Tax=Mycolicibacterium xanthum TaxID=2796469 RepID=UPI001C84D810|nr:tyrosine-type recombinase/integrase [Mycolicibacterium xanthum]MBX7431118.1 tyrosine-type recombinase/integrase [Mycolicibacterium xanthum]
MPESLESLRTSFNRSLRVEGKADRTLVLYGQSITYFSQWLEQRGQMPDVSNLTRDNVLHWLDHLRSKGQTAGTIQTRWRGLRRFVNWLHAEEIITGDPLAGIVIDKPEPPPVPVLTDEDLAALIGACKGKGFRERRDEALIRLLIDCGMRVSEITGIDLSDLDLDGETVIVTGKGSRVRNAYFGAKTGQALDRYLRERAKHRHASSSALFLGERGRFTPDGVRERVKVRAEMAGLDPAAVHPHRFRHTNAHDFLLAGGQERDLKRLMGWRSDTMLERYGASAADHRAREAARRLRRGDRV